MTKKKILFPACLYGDYAGTKARWNKVVRRAWKEGGWESAIADLELISVASKPGNIDIVAGRYRSFITADAWHMHWIPELRPFPISDFPAKKEKWTAFSLSGMNELWHTVGLLDASAYWLTPHEMRPKTFRASVYWPALQHLIYWLPELESLADRYSTGVMRFSELLGGAWFSYAFVLLGFVYPRKKAISRLYQEVIKQGSHSVSRLLLEHEIIIRDGDGRFKLCETV